MSIHMSRWAKRIYDWRKSIFRENTGTEKAISFATASKRYRLSQCITALIGNQNKNECPGMNYKLMFPSFVWLNEPETKSYDENESIQSLRGRSNGFSKIVNLSWKLGGLNCEEAWIGTTRNNKLLDIAVLNANEKQLTKLLNIKRVKICKLGLEAHNPTNKRVSLVH